MAKIKVEGFHFAKEQTDEIFTYWNNRNITAAYSKKLKIIFET